MSWALKDAPVPDPVAHLILIGLADHAADDGSNARPSRATLADYAHVTARTVGTKLKLLEESGVIRRGDQQQVAHLRSDRRPVVWDLNLAAMRGDSPDGGKDFPVVDDETDDGRNPASPRVEDMEDDGGNGASPRSSHGGNTASPRTPHDRNPASPRTGERGENCFLQNRPLTTNYLSSSSSYVGNADENGSQVEIPNTTTITENPESSRDVVDVAELQSHDLPGAWNPSPQALAEAKAACELLNLKLHIARYRVVKKEQNKPCSNGEWLRWAIADEAKMQDEARKERVASRQERRWYDVAD